MRLIIAGGRDYEVTSEDIAKLDQIHAKRAVSKVVSGCARGVDFAGERWAAQNHIPVSKFPADWTKHGKSAGPIRNREMAEYADAVALFPGGRGTQDMHNAAVKAGLMIFDFRA